MLSWISYLKNALARQQLDDPIAKKKEKTSMKVRLKNLWPSISRHKRKGIVGALLLIFTSLLGFPLPLTHLNLPQITAIECKGGPITFRQNHKRVGDKLGYLVLAPSAERALYGSRRL